jgi:DNA-binding response OmpR family regulator
LVKVRYLPGRLWNPEGVRILVVEDDPAIAEPLVAGLARNGFEPQHVREGRRALDAVDSADLVLLDLGLPDLDGSEVCRQLRARSAVPIIVVSARSDEVDRVLLLEMGADDYVVKPFGLRELIARIRAVSRRAGVGGVAPTRLEVGPLAIDLRTHEVTANGEPVALTPKEFDLLAHLASDPGAALSRRNILEEVWDENWYGSSKTLDVHVASLRRKLGHPEWIQAVRGVGFKLVTDGPPPEAVPTEGGA